jgi:hypothetical protein
MRSSRSRRRGSASPGMRSGRARAGQEMNKRKRTTTVVGTFHSKWRPACTCRRCHARRARQQPRMVESTLAVVGRPIRADWKKRSRQRLLCAGLLLLVLLLLSVMGMLWDSCPLAPLLFRPTANVIILPTRANRQTTLVVTAVTGTPDASRQEVAARFVSATPPVLVVSG